MKISCEDINKFWAALPTPMLTARVLMIIAVFCSSLSVVCFYLGSNFTEFFTTEMTETKRYHREQMPAKIEFAKENISKFYDIKILSNSSDLLFSILAQF